MNKNSPINDWIKDIREQKLKKAKKKDKKDHISLWKDKIIINEEILDSLNIIIRTKGCTWAKKNGCSMCGYIYDTNQSITQKDIYNQINNALDKKTFNNEFFVKIFTSGSFLDTKEISKKLRKKIIKRLKKEKNFTGLSIESRPEYIKEEKLEYLNSQLKNYVIGIGLETANDKIRKECINKGFTYKEYKKALKKIKKHEGLVKTYLLLKPPFLSEKTAMKELKRSIKKTANLGSEKISINPCNVQKGTIVEKLYKNKEYRPPWLWTLKKVLEQTQKVKSDLISDPIGAGKDRGIHNCGNCDKDLIKSIKRFSKTQNKSDLIEKNCECKEEWKTVLEIEEKSHNLIT